MSHAPLFAPCAGWSYSNTDYVLAGMIIQKVTGQPYGVAVEQRIIEPLSQVRAPRRTTPRAQPARKGRAASL